MENIIEELGKGILRAVAYIFVEVLFNFVFYYIGWPICKIFTLGKYPKKVDYDYSHTMHRVGSLCCVVGFIIVAMLAAYLFWD